SCDELKLCWLIQEKLRGGGYLDLAMKKDPAKAIDTLLQENKDAKQIHEALVKKLTDDKIIDKPEDADKGIDTLLADRKTDRTKPDDLDKEVKDKTKKLDDTEKLAKETKDKLEKELKDTIAADEAKLKTATEAATAKDDLLKKVVKELVDSKFLDEKADTTV